MSIIPVPKPKPFYVVNSNTKAALDYVTEATNRGENINVLVRGNTGSGKSALPREYAAKMKRPFATVEVGLMSDPSQIFGSMALRERNGISETVWIPGLFTRALETENCVIHLQEINRIESDKVLNAVFSILDESQRQLWIDDREDFVTVAKGVSFFASMNEGYEFIGTMTLDSALEDRFPVKLTLDYLPAEQEERLLTIQAGLLSEKARELVGLINSMRNNAQNPAKISTRNAIEIAKLIKHGLSYQRAFTLALGGNNETLERILLNMQLMGNWEDMEAESWSMLL